MQVNKSKRFMLLFLLGWIFLLSLVPLAAELKDMVISSPYMHKQIEQIGPIDLGQVYGEVQLRCEQMTRVVATPKGDSFFVFYEVYAPAYPIMGQP